MYYMKNNAENCLLKRYSDCCFRSFAAKGNHMPWIFIGLVIYTTCITPTDTIDINSQSFSNMDEVNKKICCARIREGSSLTTRRGELLNDKGEDNVNFTRRT